MGYGQPVGASRHLQGMKDALAKRFILKTDNPFNERVECTKTEGENDMSEPIYPPASQGFALKRRELAPTIQSAFDAFSESVFANGALLAKIK